ncbi:hypothetical protein MF672_019195 [Actinomadura sp. ATCC 31491]|uniref:Transmembrane protein n=1 Tax=Actinomadura luzonensis TaxID=2805427 RepID=A0ABT0FU91_9ACTN|nr:hypothetical protein [Actinomadura luzonensis]MCK2215906.1 hypothetical protein [Actinomadura luzonensis]
MERVAWWVRRHRFDGNPLRRRTDRLESAGMLVALLLVLLSVWPAVAAGRQAYASGAQPAGRARATATLLTDVPVVDLSFGVVVAGESATARWTTPAGERRTGPVRAPVLAKAGTPVPIWLGPDGWPAPAPPRPAELRASSVVTGILVWIVAAVLVSTAFAGFGWLLDQRRHRAWDAAWAAHADARRAP